MFKKSGEILIMGTHLVSKKVGTSPTLVCTYLSHCHSSNMKHTRNNVITVYLHGHLLAIVVFLSHGTLLRKEDPFLKIVCTYIYIYIYNPTFEMSD